MKIAPAVREAPKRARRTRKTKDSLAKLTIASAFVPLGVELIRLIGVLVKALVR